MHALAQFHAIARMSLSGSGGPIGISPPANGNLPAHLLTVLCGVLAEHTKTRESCWFCLWNGYGWIHGSPAASVISFSPSSGTSGDAGQHSVPPALPPHVLQGPKVSLPHREYLLFRGPVGAARELGWSTPWGFAPQSPNLLWPQDHAWCVATEIDLFCTLVGGSEKLAAALMAEPRLETWRVFPGDPIAWDSDKVNA